MAPISAPTLAHYQTLEYARITALMRQWQNASAIPLKVLDYGCGPGKYLRLFRSLGAEVVGVDLNPQYVKDGLNAGFSMQLANETTFVSKQFDVIFLSHLIEHLEPDVLISLVPKLCEWLNDGGKLIIVTPTLGERFYHDVSHIRPYYPQSIRHAFGQQGAPLSYAATTLIALTDIYFFNDPYRTRTWRSFYVGTGLKRKLVNGINNTFDFAWKLSGGRFGSLASWLGVYQKTTLDCQNP